MSPAHTSPVCTQQHEHAGALKKAAVGTAGSGKMCYLSFMVMDLLGPSVGCLSLELQHYRHDVRLLVNHGCGMLKVGWVLPYG